MAPKRVAHLVSSSEGGIRRHVRYLATHAPRGYETIGVWGPAELASYFADVPFHVASRRSSVTGADIVHAHGLTAGLSALRRRGQRLVLTVHTDIHTQGRTARSAILRTLARVIAARADAVIVGSERVGQPFPGARLIPPAFEPLPPAVRSRADVRAELGTPADATVVITVARLHPDKGLPLFVDAVRATDAHAWICGDGPLREELEQLVRGTRIALLGHRDDVADLLAAADVFVLPSVGEAYGIAVAEAIQAGLPVVASTAGAIPDIAGDAGLLVPPGDGAALSDAVRSVVADQELRVRLAGRARAMRRPNPDELVARIGEVYDEVCR